MHLPKRRKNPEPKTGVEITAQALPQYFPMTPVSPTVLTGWYDEPEATHLPSEKRAEPVVGWRRFRTLWCPEGLVLGGYEDTRWNEARLHAKCVDAYPSRMGAIMLSHFGTQRPPRMPHTAPKEGCSCGIYSYKSAKAALMAMDPENNIAVLGRIQASGRVIEHTDGYRAECADIEFLCVLHTEEVARLREEMTLALLPRELRARYRVPVLVIKPTEFIRLFVEVEDADREAPAGAGDSGASKEEGGGPTDANAARA